MTMRGWLTRRALHGFQTMPAPCLRCLHRWADPSPSLVVAPLDPSLSVTRQTTQARDNREGTKIWILGAEITGIWKMVEMSKRLMEFWHLGLEDMKRQPWSKTIDFDIFNILLLLKDEDSCMPYRQPSGITTCIVLFLPLWVLDSFKPFFL